jgi:hypothetical protein
MYAQPNSSGAVSLPLPLHLHFVDHSFCMLTSEQLKPGGMNKEGLEIYNLIKISSTFRL